MEDKIKELEEIIFKIVRNKPLEDKDKKVIDGILEKNLESDQ